MEDTTKKLAESILTDFASESIANILLKSKILAAKTHDKVFLDWISMELKGYKENVPNYRIIDAHVNIDIHKGFQDIIGYSFPVDMIKDGTIRNRLSHISVLNPITEIEAMSTGDDSSFVQMDIPVWIWQNHMRQCVNGDIQKAYQFANISALSSIVVSVKSILLDYIIKISEECNVQFTSLIKPEIPTTIINGAVVNTGSGTIITGNIESNIGDNKIDFQKLEYLKEIIEKLDEIMLSVENDDYKELSQDIIDELNKKAPSKKCLKRCFQAINGLLNGVVSGVIANQMTPLVTSALSLL